MTAAITVAVQGEPGCNSALAADRFFSKEVTILPCKSFALLFDAVKRGKVDFGMAPVENSLGGSIHPVWDLLAANSLPLRGEIYFHVRHCLIAHPGVRLEELRFIYSHEQALTQCQTYIRKLSWIAPENVIPAYDTAGAVEMIKARGKRQEAAIAPPQAAALYNMAVLAEDIQTTDDNYTRFLVLAHRPHRTEACRYRTTLILTLSDCARRLPALLAALADHRIDLLKVETRKQIGHPWEYIVYLECAGHAEKPPLVEALTQIGELAAACHLVGSYPLAATPVSRPLG